MTKPGEELKAYLLSCPGASAQPTNKHYSLEPAVPIRVECMDTRAGEVIKRNYLVRQVFPLAFFDANPEISGKPFWTVLKWTKG